MNEFVTMIFLVVIAAIGAFVFALWLMMRFASEAREDVAHAYEAALLAVKQAHVYEQPPEPDDEELEELQEQGEQEMSRELSRRRKALIDNGVEQLRATYAGKGIGKSEEELREEAEALVARAGIL